MNLTKMNYKSILIVTYGRSGSTLLQGVLNSIDGIHIRGENMEFCWHLYNAWKALSESRQYVSLENSMLLTSPWYGSEQLSPDGFLRDAKRIVKEQLTTGLPDNICYGFKEIRYIDHLDELELYIGFLCKIFPDPLILFNTRDHDAVSISGWWKDADTQALKKTLKKADDAFRIYSMSHANCYVMRYERLIQGTDKLGSFFNYLGVNPNVERIEQTLLKKHSYDNGSLTVKNALKARSWSGGDSSTFTSNDLTLDSSSAIRNVSPSGVVVFSVVKNEAMRLPWFLSYYRALGCKSFVIIDNGSTDKTLEYLRLQSDVVLYTSPPEQFSASQYGRDWFHILTKKHAHHRWVLCADVDELICWPGYKIQGLDWLVSTADRFGLNRVFTPMIDAYSDKPANELSYIPGQPFGEICPWIDPVSTLKASWSKNGRLFLFGGPRARHYDSELQPPLLSKQSLYYVENGGPESAGSHFDTLNTPSLMIAPLLHYKFLPDFASKCDIAITEGQHWNNAEEYVAYKESGIASKSLKIDKSIYVRNGLDLIPYIEEIGKLIINKLSHA